MPTTKLDAPARLAKISAVAYGPPKASLDTIVADAAKLARAPAAMINLVAESIQYIRAATGLPVELGVSRATSRCDSFCQFVVQRGSAFVVPDSRTDERVPKKLAEIYNLRAYAGVPIYIEREIVGSLCVIDSEPRDFDAGTIHILSSLAASASALLEGEWREYVGSSHESPGRLALEAASLTRLAEAQARGEITREVAQAGRFALSELEGAMARSVETLPDSMRSMIEGFLATVPADERSFMLARIALKTDFARLVRDPAKLEALASGLRAAIAELRTK